MIPLRDNVQAHRTPVVNYSIIGLTAIVFIAQLANELLTYQYGMVPLRVTDPDWIYVISGRDELGRIVQYAIEDAASPLLTIFTCIFLHGGFLHFAGNMWFLYIFGDNVEDRFGHVGYAIFYVAAGILASLTHLVTNASSPIPTIGASGAAAGVMGAYLVLYPRAQVLTLIPFYVIFTQVLPASLFLGIWFLMQLTGVIGPSAGAGGVAWWAHIGGFVAGAVVVVVLRKIGRLPDQRVEWVTHRKILRGRRF